MTMEEIKRVMEEIGGLQRYEPIEFGYSGSRHYSPTNIQRSDDGDFVRLEEVLSKFSALEARMQAMEALTSDAIGLVKVLANQVHSLPQAAVSSLTPRTFNEMFNNRDGAAYGQASRILERYELLFAPKSTNPTT